MRVGRVLLGDHDRFIDVVLRQGLRLHKIISRNVEAVAGIQGHRNDSSLFRKRMHIVINIEQVDWAVHLLEVLVNADVDLLPEYWRDESEFFGASEDADVLLVNLIFGFPREICPLVIERRPF